MSGEPLNDFERALIERRHLELHAMQSGVAMEMTLGIKSSATTPKHLRVGVNTALVDIGAVVDLLIDKGVFTRVEYLTAIANAMTRERERYEALLSEQMGTKVSLG